MPETPPGGNIFHAAPRCQPLLRAIGLDAEAVFSHPQITVWRQLHDRENCTLDGAWPDGTPARLHIKRYAPCRSRSTPADAEALGLSRLEAAAIPTAPLVGWGALADGRSFIILEDLVGFRAADKLIAQGFAFERLLESTAALAARLHSAGLHHRDLYLCHFFVKPAPSLDVRLIDAARVKPLPRWPFRNRWIVKDLAQFWYSARLLGTSDAQRMAWLEAYGRIAQIEAHRWRSSIERKVARIRRHHEALSRQQPARNISIPGA